MQGKKNFKIKKNKKQKTNKQTNKKIGICIKIKLVLIPNNNCEVMRQ